MEQDLPAIDASPTTLHDKGPARKGRAVLCLRGRRLFVPLSSTTYSLRCFSFLLTFRAAQSSISTLPPNRLCLSRPPLQHTSNKTHEVFGSLWIRVPLVFVVVNIFFSLSFDHSVSLPDTTLNVDGDVCMRWPERS